LVRSFFHPLLLRSCWVGVADEEISPKRWVENAGVSGQAVVGIIMLQLVALQPDVAPLLPLPP